MDILRVQTGRLLITHFDESMITSVHLNSLDEDNREFVPDEVFETVEKAQDAVRFLMQCYSKNNGPFVYPVLLLASNENIGYVQAIPMKKGGWEIGYHIAKTHTGKGYATEAVRAFVPIIMKLLRISEIWGISRADNIASCRVLEKLGFEFHERVIENYHGKKHEVNKYMYRFTV